MNHVDQFQQHRPLLFSIAYRMLGTVMDAEDIVQEAFLRWQRAPEPEVRSPKSYLTTIVTRLAIDQLRSARERREHYVGPWLPEPLLTEPESTPMPEMAESISTAFLVMLETLTPTERAAFLLREVFDYDYPEVARIIDKSEANCRQLVKRAKSHIAAGRPRFTASEEHRRRLTRQFVETCRRGDLGGLEALLARDVTLWSDGGGKVQAALNPIRGAPNVARFLVGILRKAPPDLEIRPASINGQPGYVNYVGGRVFGTLALDIRDIGIGGIYLVVNPEKLRRVQAGSATH